MKMFKTEAWQYEKTGIDGNCELFEVNIFDYAWENTGEYVEVKDPVYRQDYRFPIYEADIGGKIHRFVAGEFSNCVYGFYLFKY